MSRENKRKACVAILLAFASKKRVERKTWSKKWLQERKEHSHLSLMDKIILYKEMDDFENYFRMSHDDFEHLLKLVTPFVKKEDTVMREAISPKEKLAITLHYFSTGAYFKNDRFTAIMSRQSISQAVEDCCEALIYVLKDFIKMPTTIDEWKSVADDFKNLHNFYNCIGAIDGKHIKIKHPPGTGSLYYNYKGSYSIVLMAIANARKEFIMIDIGCNGRVSDGGVLYYSKFWERLQQGRLNLPRPSALPNTVEEYPYVFIGDEAFALGPNLMKPYPQKKASKEEELYNRRLSRARSVIECTFGILAAKFGVFQKAISLSPDKATKVTAACCYLHNFLMKKEVIHSCSDAIADNFEQSNECNPMTNAKTLRDNFCKYYNNEK